MATNAGNFVRHKIFRGEPGFIYKKINRFGDLSRNTMNYGQGRPRDNKKPTKFEMTLFKGWYPVKFPLQKVAKFQIRQSIFYGEGKIAEWVCDIAYGMTCGMAYMRNVLLVEWLFARENEVSCSLTYIIPKSVPKRKAASLNTAGSNHRRLSSMDDETSSSSGKWSTLISLYHCHPE